MKGIIHYELNYFENSSTLKKEATGYFETLVYMYHTTHRYIPDDINFHSHCLKNFKAHVTNFPTKQAVNQILYGEALKRLGQRMRRKERRFSGRTQTPCESFVSPKLKMYLKGPSHF
jgi:hypothetical protein